MSMTADDHLTVLHYLLYPHMIVDDATSSGPRPPIEYLQSSIMQHQDGVIRHSKDLCLLAAAISAFRSLRLS